MSKPGQFESGRGAINNYFRVTDVNKAAVGKVGHAITLLTLIVSFSGAWGDGPTSCSPNCRPDLSPFG